jgi:hypothetical protein
MQTTRRTHEQLVAEELAQPRQRVAGRGLRQCQLAARFGHRSGAVDRRQHAQQVEVEVAEVHRQSIHTRECRPF